MIDLSLVETEELVKALSSRFDGVIVCGVQNGGGNKKEDRYYQYYNGSIATAKGLIFVIDEHLNFAWADTETEEE